MGRASHSSEREPPAAHTGPVKLGVLVSGRGSNLEAVLGARIPGLEVAIVVSNRPGVRALEVAERFGTPTRVMPRADFADAESRDAAIGRTLAAAGCDLALLAGYDQLLTRGYFATFAGRTINIHPSLLPAHGGRGMLGRAVHAAVLAAGEIESGATIHEVTPELDAGPILAQARVPVRPGDDPARLAERVVQAEHRLLIEALAGLAADRSIGMPRARMAGASAVRADSHETHERPLPHA
jgi:phosphoribosylglycinamide formyltransferase-1